MAQATIFDYGTKSNEARKAYQTGCQQILDLGQWTKAEESYREAVRLDPEFQLAWAQVGRIRSDPKSDRRFMQSLKIR
jgi:Tfp pilus assembly protein PilF